MTRAGLTLTLTHHVLGAVLDAVCAVSILQVTGRSVGVQDAEVLWTLQTCVETHECNLIRR